MARFKEGEHYKVLDQAPSKKPTVTEFFSFYSAHCAQFEELVQELQKRLPKGTRFERVHVSFMGGNMARPMSQAYATMVALGVESKMVPVMFDVVHNMRKPPRDEDELRQFFLDQGVKAANFDSMFNSFMVHSMTRRFDKSFDESGLTGVPAVIVNNKYLVETQGIKSKKGYFELVNFLLAKFKSRI